VAGEVKAGPFPPAPLIKPFSLCPQRPILRCLLLNLLGLACQLLSALTDR